MSSLGSALAWLGLCLGFLFGTVMAAAVAIRARRDRTELAEAEDGLATLRDAILGAQLMGSAYSTPGRVDREYVGFATAAYESSGAENIATTLRQIGLRFGRAAPDEPDDWSARPDIRILTAQAREMTGIDGAVVFAMLGAAAAKLSPVRAGAIEVALGKSVHLDDHGAVVTGLSHVLATLRIHRELAVLMR